MIIVITGASSGIGAALAEAAARRGWTPVLLARRESALREVAARCGPGAHVVVADVTRRGDIARAVRETIDALGRIDVWVNNAGQGITRPPSELTDEDVDEMIRVNVKSVLYGTQEVLPHFKARGDGQIVNVSSMLGRVPSAVFRAAYNGAKHYVNALTANFRDELREQYPGIQISLVSPGVVRTEFGKNARHGGPDSRELPYSQSAEEVAEVIAGVIEARRDDVYTRAGSKALVLEYLSKLGQDP